MSTSDWASGETLLANWYQRMRVTKQGHYEAARRLESLHYKLGVPIMVLSTIAGTSVFAALGKSPDPLMQVAVGLVSISAGVLAALQTFLGASARAEKHRAAAARYGAIGRDVEVLQALSPSVRGDPQEVLDRLRTQLDDLALESPGFTDRIRQYTKAQQGQNEKKKPPVKFTRG